MRNKATHIPRDDEEPEVDDLRFYYEEATVDFLSEMSDINERARIGGYYDQRKARWVA